MHIKPLRILVLLAILLTALPAFSQEKEQSDSLVRLISADALRQYEQHGKTFRKVTGSARFLHNDTYLLCDTAVWDVDQNIIDAWGNVSILQEQTVLTSENMKYIVDQDLAQFRGSLVQLQDKDNNTLRTRELDYNTKDSVAIFRGGASMRDKDGQIIESKDGIYDSKPKTFTFTRDVNMFTDSIFVKTNRILYESDKSLAHFGSGTNAWKEENMLSAESGWYNSDTETFFFKDDVHVLTDTQEGWSDTLFFYRSTMNVEMFGNAQLNDTTRNVYALAGNISYVDSLSLVTLCRKPAVISMTEQDGVKDTVYFGADTVRYYAMRMCDISETEIADSETRLKNVAIDPVGALRKSAAEAAAKKKEEEAMKDPNYKAKMAAEEAKKAKAAEEAKKSAPAEAASAPVAPVEPEEPESAEVAPVEPEEPESAEVAPSEAEPAAPAETAAPEPAAPVVPQEPAEAASAPVAPSEAEPAAPAETAAPEPAAPVVPQEPAEAASAPVAPVEPEEPESAETTPSEAEPEMPEDTTSAFRNTIMASLDSLSTGIDSLSGGIDSLAMADSIARADSIAYADSIASLDTTKIGFLSAVHNVRVFRKDMQVVCDSLLYTDLDSLARLFVNPIVWNEVQQQYIADSITIVVQNNSMKQANLMSNAFIHMNQDDIHFNQIKGAEMTAYFDPEGQLQRFDALGGSAALFYIEENDALATVNKKDSKMLSAELKDGEIQRIYYFEAPKSDAYPVVQLSDDDKELKGFSWQPDKRPKDRYAITDIELRPGERTRYESRPRAKYKETDIYFPGYIEGIYKEIIIRDSLEKVRAYERERQRKFEEAEAKRIADSTATALQLDSLAQARELRITDSLRNVAVQDSLHRVDSINAIIRDSIAFADSVKNAEILAAESMKILTPEEKAKLREAQKLQKKQERERKKKERQEAKLAREKAREERWAKLDARDAEKAALKEAKAAEKQKKREEAALKRKEKEAAREQRLLEKYIEEYRKKLIRQKRNKAKPDSELPSKPSPYSPEE